VEGPGEEVFAILDQRWKEQGREEVEGCYEESEGYLSCWTVSTCLDEFWNDIPPKKMEVTNH
jgi:hypothetical protein